LQYKQSGRLDSRSLKPPFLTGFLQNINGIQVLMEDLSTNFEFQWLPTRYLSQDFIETVYSQTRSLCGQNNHPNPTEFRPAIRNVMVQHLSKLTNGGNCEFEDIANVVSPEDLDQAETQMRMQHESAGLDIRDEEPSPYLVFEEFTTDVVQMGLVKYITGYSIRNLKHDPCKNNLLQTDTESLDEDPTNNYIIEKKYQENSQLVVPNTLAFTLGLNVNKVFCENYTRILARNRRNVRQRLQNLIKYDGDVREICCRNCFDIIVMKLLNTFINGRIKRANDAKNMTPKNSAVSAGRKRTKTNQKAKKLNIS
jgi:hypothetical protein